MRALIDLDSGRVDHPAGTEIDVLGFVHHPDYGLEVVYRDDQGALYSVPSWAVRMLPNTSPPHDPANPLVFGVPWSTDDFVTMSEVDAAKPHLVEAMKAGAQQVIIGHHTWSRR